MSHPDLAGISTSGDARKRRLDAFRASVENDDAEMVAFWREKSPAEHAAAGARLSDMAAQVAAQTGLTTPSKLEYPSLSALRRRRTEQDA